MNRGVWSELMIRKPTFALLLIVMMWSAVPSGAQDAAEIVRASIDNWRGKSSYGEMTMTIHRPTWERTMSMRAWTQGSKKTLVRVTAPKKDAGNGTLMVDNNMWSYAPKVNRVIKVPSSMMAQSWMGSDFSNKDIARVEDIIDEYDHTIVATDEVDGVVTTTIRSIPHEDAAVVWGSEVLKIRDDHVVTEHAFYDQDGGLVKTLVTTDIDEMGGRTIATRQRMVKTEDAGEWTEIAVLEVEYELELKDSLFTLSNLRNPRD